jgi:tetratricopeptide (TPR) repeat protein
MRKIALVFVLLVLGSASVFAQKSYEKVVPERIFREALNLFENEKFVPAKESFEKYLSLTSGNDGYRADAEYYQGLCAMNLFHPDAEFLLTNFVRNHPDSHWCESVYLELANFKYKSKSYKQSLEWFNKVEEKHLLAEERSSFYYKRGFVKFDQKMFADARVDFAKVKDEESEYAPAATYYYAYMAYTNKDYQVALESFSKLKEDKDFKSVVPYFISQIYYVQKRFDELLAYAPPLINAEENVKNNYPNANEEIAHLIGDAYFIQEKYTEALPYLEKYHMSPTAKPSVEDYYQLGFCYYRNGNFERAIDSYSHCTKEDSPTSQLANYNIGDCYLKLEQKEYARTAFESASKQTHNVDVQEDALFNYAKLAFELSYNPFHEAISAFEGYLEKYPNSARHDEAYDFLLNVYLKSRNYERALASLDKMKVKDIRAKTSYQIVAFNRGVELYQAESLSKAEEYFTKSLEFPINTYLMAQAKYWMGEICYRQNKYPKAKEHYLACIAEPAAFNSEYYALANYSLGYTYFKLGVAQKDYDASKPYYSNANTAFRKFVDSKEADEVKKGDAYLRIGDCFFVSKSYKQAIESYTKGSASQKDYILFQKALCEGYEGNRTGKINLLKSLVESESNSKYKVDAAFELGTTYLGESRNAEAKSVFLQLMADEPTSNYTRRILVNLCLIYRNEENDAKVKATWNTLYVDYGNDKIILDALEIVKPVLIDDIEFQNQITHLTVADVSASEIEDGVFAKASAPAYAGECSKAKGKLESYLNQYPQALHSAEANFLLADCFKNEGNKESAITYYERVIALPFSDFTEEALNNAADIRLQQGEYANAIGHLLKIESAAVSKKNVEDAQMALLIAYYSIDEMGLAREYADKVIADASANAENRAKAYLWRARMKMKEEEFASALEDYTEVSKRGGEGAAEAAFQNAYVEYKLNSLDKAEKSVFKVIEKYASFDKWKYESFLLLSDIYVAKPDYYQARKTLDAIISKVKNPDILARAEQKKRDLEELENPKPRALEIPLDNTEENIQNDEFHEE